MATVKETKFRFFFQTFLFTHSIWNAFPQKQRKSMSWKLFYANYPNQSCASQKRGLLLEHCHDLIALNFQQSPELIWLIWFQKNTLQRSKCKKKSDEKFHSPHILRDYKRNEHGAEGGSGAQSDGDTHLLKTVDDEKLYWGVRNLQALLAGPWDAEWKTESN